MALDESHRRSIIRDGAGIGLATGAYGVSFGAIAVSGGLSVLQAVALSLLMFTGASQFAFVGVVAGGGAAASAVATAVLLGARNAFYGLRLSGLLGLGGVRRALAAQIVIDESTALAVAQDDLAAQRTGFFAAGLGVYVLWGLGTLLGAVGGELLEDPRVLGLDAAPAAAFVALLAPQLRDRLPRVVAVTAAATAIISVAFVPAGVPILLAAAVALVAGART